MFYKKQKKPEAENIGRRRPVINDASKRPAMFSYYASRLDTDENAGRTLERHVPQRSPMARLAIIGGSLVAALVLASVLVLSPNPNVVVAGSEASHVLLQSENVYQAEASNLFRSSLLNRTKLSVSAASIEREMHKTFPELKEVAVSLPPLGNTPTVTVESFAPALIVINARGSFMIDETGRARMASSQVPDTVRRPLPTVNDKSGLTAETGDIILPSGDVQFIQDALALLRSAAVSWDSVTLPPDASELHVSIANKPYLVKFNLRGEVRQQVGTFLALKKKLESDNVTPSEYIDVRVNERAYYK